MKRSPLRARPPADHSDEPGYREWKARVYGACQACGERDLLLRHHVILEQHVRAHGGDPWDLRNALLIGAGFKCSCHKQHHAALRRLALDVIPPDAIEFGVELLGRERAHDYLARHYR